MFEVVVGAVLPLPKAYTFALQSPPHVSVLSPLQGYLQSLGAASKLPIVRVLPQ
jgi:hypothetical protein